MIGTRKHLICYYKLDEGILCPLSLKQCAEDSLSMLMHLSQMFSFCCLSVFI